MTIAWWPDPLNSRPIHRATHTHTDKNSEKRCTHIVVKGLGSHKSIDGVIHLLSEANASLQSEQETKAYKKLIIATSWKSRLCLHSGDYVACRYQKAFFWIELSGTSEEIIYLGHISLTCVTLLCQIHTSCIGVERKLLVQSYCQRLVFVCWLCFVQ